MTFSTRELLEQGIDPEAVAIRKWRVDRKIRQTAFAKLAGMSADTLGRYERGDLELSPKAKANIGVAMNSWPWVKP